MNTIEPSRYSFALGLACAALLVIPAAPAAEAAERIASGKWESAMTTDGVTNTVTYCISPAEAASINGDSKSGRDFAQKKAESAGSHCAIMAYDIKGDTGSYTLSCGSRTITDATVYHGQTSEGVKTTASEGKTVTTRVKSRRVGTCT